MSGLEAFNSDTDEEDDEDLTPEEAAGEVAELIETQFKAWDDDPDIDFHLEGDEVMAHADDLRDQILRTSALVSAALDQ